MKCERCQRDIAENESFTHLGKVLCDDCYIDAMSPVKACDPWAVYSATNIRESSGLKGEEGLTPLQRDIFKFVKNKGKATATEVITHFHINQHDLEIVVATLRHCELVRGQKEGDKIFLVPF